MDLKRESRPAPLTAKQAEILEKAMKRHGIVSRPDDRNQAVPKTLLQFPRPEMQEIGKPVLGDSGLTPREREVLVLVAHGLSNAEIGKRLFITRETVKTHLKRVRLTLGARDRTHAVAIAYETGLLRPGSIG